MFLLLITVLLFSVTVTDKNDLFTTSTMMQWSDIIDIVRRLIDIGLQKKAERKYVSELFFEDGKDENGMDYLGRHSKVFLKIHETYRNGIHVCCEQWNKQNVGLATLPLPHLLWSSIHPQGQKAEEINYTDGWQIVMDGA